MENSFTFLSTLVLVFSEELNSHTDLPFHALFSNALKSQPCCHVRLLGIHRQVLAECEPLAASPDQLTELP